MPDYKIPKIKIQTKAPEWLEQTDRPWWHHENLFDDEKCRQIKQGMTEKDIEDFRKLHKILLSIGGYETCFPVIEEDMQAILTRGYYRTGTSKLMKGRPSQCHANTCDLYEENKSDHDVTICTGYALSNDGLWRQHSWLLQRYQTRTQNRIRLVETTVKRIAYFGFEMTPEEAEEFCDENW